MRFPREKESVISQRGVDHGPHLPLDIDGINNQRGYFNFIYKDGSLLNDVDLQTIHQLNMHNAASSIAFREGRISAEQMIGLQALSNQVWNDITAESRL